MTEYVEINGKKYLKAEDGKPVAFHDLKKDRFPFTITAFKYGGLSNGKRKMGSKVWEQTITEPGSLTIPALKTKYKSPVVISILYADGDMVIHWPDGNVWQRNLNEQ